MRTQRSGVNRGEIVHLSDRCRILLLVLWPFVGLLKVLAGLFQSAEGIVVGLKGLAIFVDGAFALPGNIENLAELEVAPDLGPARLTVAVQGGAIRVGGGLVVSLQEEDLSDAVVGQRTVLVEIERLVEFGQGGGQVSLLLQRLAAQNGGPQFYIGRIREHVMVGIDGDAPWPAESFYRERRVRPHHFDALVFGLAIG